MSVGDLPVQRRRRTILLLGLGGSVGLLLVMGYFGSRQWALWKLNATNTPLTPWVRWYVTRSSDPALNRALVRRTEYTTWEEVSSEVDIIWSDKGLEGVKPLMDRIDYLLEERKGMSQDVRTTSRIDVRLFSLFEALEFLLQKSGIGLSLGGLYTGSVEKEEVFIERYKGVRQELLEVGKNVGEHDEGPPKPGDETTRQHYVWYGWNRLVEVKDGEATVARYAYDGTARRGASRGIPGTQYGFFCRPILGGREIPGKFRGHNTVFSVDRFRGGGKMVLCPQISQISPRGDWDFSPGVDERELEGSHGH